VVKPGDDFFRYCNGAWLAGRKFRPTGEAWAPSWSCETRATSGERPGGRGRESKRRAGTNARKIADLFHSYMDEAGIEAKGMAPLEPQLKAIAAIQDKKALASALGKTLRADVDALNNTNFHTANLFGLWWRRLQRFGALRRVPDAGGLQLPDREYYTGQNERMKNLRTAYQAHVAAMLKLAGFSESERARENCGAGACDCGETPDAGGNENIHNANNPGSGRNLRQRRRAGLGGIFPRSGARETGKLHRVQPARLRASRHWWRRSRWRRGRIF